MFYKKKLSPIVWVFGVLVAAAMLPATLAAGGMLSNYSQAVLDQGPIAYWQFEDASSADGATAENSSASGTIHDGVYSGGSVALVPGPSLPGLPGNAAWFDGVDDFVTAATTGFPSGSSDRTAIAWVRMGEDTGAHYFFRYGPSILTRDFSVGRAHPAGGGAFTASQYGSGVYSSHTPVAVDQWYFLAVTVSGGTSTPTWTIYVDDLAPDTATPTTNTLLMNALIGWTWEGEVDEVAIFDKALTGGEIRAIYNAASIIPEPSTLVLGLSGLGLLLPVLRRRKKRFRI